MTPPTPPHQYPHLDPYGRHGKPSDNDFDRGARDHADFSVGFLSAIIRAIRGYSLFAALRDESYHPASPGVMACQNVSVGITYDGVKIDLVPGRQQAGYRNYHSLWRRKASTWTQTNVLLHIERVRDSGRTGEIRAIKTWRANHGLDFPSFYLELIVLDALAGCGSSFANNVQRTLGYIADNLTARTVEDPANTNNTVSDDLTLPEKQVIAAQARLSYLENSWGHTLW